MPTPEWKPAPLTLLFVILLLWMSLSFPLKSQMPDPLPVRVATQLWPAAVMMPVPIVEPALDRVSPFRSSQAGASAGGRLSHAGSRTEADDAVQEAWLRLSRSNAGEIENLGGWLTTVVAHICAPALPEKYLG